MQGIEVTLQRNKQLIVVNSEDFKIIGSENNATPILVHFPEEYENYSKRVDFKNIKNEKWTIGLYTPEDERIQYGQSFDKMNFLFTLPSAVTIRGELKIQFVAYLPDESETYVPFEVLKVEVRDDIMYVKKKGSENPDLILKAYEYGNKALATSREALANTIKGLEIIDTLTVSSNELDCTEHVSVNIETDDDTKHKNIKFNIPAPKQGVSYRARGPWEADTEYINNDFYIDTVSRDGCTFYCKKTNTNEEPITSADSEFWGLVADKGTSVTIVDDLSSEHSDYVLSAKQGKVLNDKVTDLQQELNKESQDVKLDINGINGKIENLQQQINNMLDGTTSFTLLKAHDIEVE